MAKSTLLNYVLLILCLGAASVPAQEPGMILPPLPTVYKEPPPDPETLPPPPQLEWAPLGPGDSVGEPGAVVASPVPPPEAETPMAPPPPPMEEVPQPGGPDRAEMELGKPDVEIWRAESEWPQMPARTSNRLDYAYVTGNAPVWLRVQFNPAMGGKSVRIKPGPGLTLDPPGAFQVISPNGECLVLAQVGPEVTRSHVIFYLEGMKTVLPVARATLQKVEQAEALNGGGE
jgi:hypothetical protein